MTERDDRAKDPQGDARVDEYDKERAAEVAEREKAYLELLRRLGKQRGGHPGEPDDDRGKDGRVPPVTPFLLVRYAPTDTGARPVPPGSPFWISPDIWVESSDPSGNPVAGQPNTMVARVFNLGAFQASPVQVDFYWGDPSLGLTPASMHLIGTAWTDVPSLSSVVVPCPVPWVPVIVNDGHECAIVNVSSWLADPIVAPFDAVADRHVGQRNLHVVEPAAAQAEMYSLQITNPFPFAVRAQVVVRAHRMRALTRERPGDFALAAVAATDAARNDARALLKLHAPGTLGHDIAAAALRRARRHPDEQPAPAFEDVGGDELRDLVKVEVTDEGGKLPGGPDVEFGKAILDQDEGDVPGFTAAVVPLEAGTFQVVRAQVRAPADLGKDEVLVVHLQGRVGDVLAGGYTVVVGHGATASPLGGGVETRATREQGAGMAERDLRDLVIEEVDDARDIYELASQLQRFLPIKSFDELAKAAGEKRLRFRDSEFDVESLRGVLPSIAFPAEDAEALVARLGHLVRVVPRSLGVDAESDQGARRIARARGDVVPGLATRPVNAVATTVLFGTRPDADDNPAPRAGEK